MPHRQTARSTALFLATLLLLPAAGHALGRGHGHGGHGKPAKEAKHARRVVTVDHALVTTREVLVARGYTVTRVERAGATQVVYFYRGNRGRGRGHGPVERIVVRPAGDVVIFDTGPSIVLADIRLRLSL